MILQKYRDHPKFKCSIFEPSHEIMALFILRKLILQTHMSSHPVGLDVRCLVRPFVYFHISCTNSEGSGKTARMRRLAWAFAGRLFDKYHNLMNWLIWFDRACPRMIVGNETALWPDARPREMLTVRSSGLATFFRGEWSWNHFYGHSLPTTDSSRAVVSY